MYFPSKSDFNILAKKGNLIPVCREFVGDLDTPVAMFKRLSSEGCSYLLESVEGGEHLGRYSFIGINPSVIFKSKGRRISVIRNGRVKEWDTETNPLSELQNIMDEYRPVEIKGLPRFNGGAVGYIGYGVVSFFENIPQKNKDDLNMPDMYFMIADTMIIFDHVMHVIKVVANASVDGSVAGAYDDAVEKIEALIDKIRRHSPASMMELPKEISQLKVESNLKKSEFEEIVGKTKEYIKSGDIIQAVLSQRFSVKIKSDPFNIYRALRSVNPSPYMYYLKGEDFNIVGSSPELLVRCDGGLVETRPIAGTRPRGMNQEEDDKLSKELLADAKERAEHIMLVDLGRNDLGRVCRNGTVRVTDLMSVEKYSHVMHIVSSVEGVLRKDKDQFDVLMAAFPAGTVSGAPKIRAMEIIDELENLNRGPYAGAVGYFSFSGNMDCAITIRTVVVKNGVAYVQAGAGIVADSNPEQEYWETVNKAKAMIKAIELAERF